MRTYRNLGITLAVVVMTFGISSVGFARSQGVQAPSARTLVAQSCGVEPLDVELMIDTSGSMGSNSSNGKTRLEWAQLAAKQLVKSLDDHGGVGGSGAHEVGLVQFAGTHASVVIALGGSTKADVDAAIDSLSSNGNTPLQEGMDAGAGDMSANGRSDAAHIAILLSDGRPNPDQGPDGNWANSSNGQRPTAGEGSAYLGSFNIQISIALGTGGTGAQSVDLALMALLGPDGAYHVVNGDELPDVFKDVYTDIKCATEPPVTEPPVTEPPVTEPPVTEPPVTEPPVTNPPVTNPPASFEQDVAGETDAPTAPSTDTSNGNGPTGPADSAVLLLVALGVLLASVAVMTPAPARRRK